ncbi:MAG: LCP family protein, partial [Chloroflexota bacterium]
GQRAIEFARSRHSLQDGSDFARSRRQQLILLAIKKKALSPAGLTKAFGVMDALSKDFKTNMNVGEMKMLADAARGINTATIQRVSIDDTNFLYDGVTPNGQDVLVPRGGSWTRLRSFIATLLMNPAIKAEDARVQFWNGSGVPGAAAEATSTVAGLGIKTLPAQNAPFSNLKRTEIQDLSQGRDPATVKYLANFFGATVVTQPQVTSAPSQADVRVILGRSYQSASLVVDSMDPTVRLAGVAPRVQSRAPVRPAATPAVIASRVSVATRPGATTGRVGVTAAPAIRSPVIARTVISTARAAPASVSGTAAVSRPTTQPAAR